MLMQVAPEGGTVSLYTVLLALIACFSLLGPGLLAWLNTKQAGEIKDREAAREEAREAREAAVALLAAERASKLTEQVAVVHDLTNSRLSKIDAELAASREETRLSREETKALLVEKAEAAKEQPLLAVTNGVAAPVEPIAVEVVNSEESPVPVATERRSPDG